MATKAQTLSAVPASLRLGGLFLEETPRDVEVTAAFGVLACAACLYFCLQFCHD